MKKFFLLLCMSISASVVFGQKFEVPEGYSLGSAEDYERYEPDVLECCEWLISNPLSNDYDSQGGSLEASSFLMAWIAGSPKVMIVLDSEMLKLMKKTVSMIGVFFAGWTYHSLTSGRVDDTAGSYTAGLESVVRVYEMSRGNIKRDKNIEKYVKMHNKGTLRAHVEKNLNK